MTDTKTTLNLLADIGGTNTRVALADDTGLRAGSIRRFRNADHTDLGAVLRTFLAQEGTPTCDGACVAVAGPVEGARARLTNLDWEITTDQIRHATGAAQVAVLNDLQAQGHALGHLPPDALLPLRTGDGGTPDAPMLVIGVGTGFNCAPVYPNGPARLVPAAEAGHASLPVQNAQELDLAQHLATAHGFAAIEEVLSGRGICAVSDWLAQRDGGTDGLTSAQILTRAKKHNPQALETLEVFTRFLGRVTGDLALTHLPFAGIFLVGGMSNAMAPWLSHLGFEKSMLDKGRFAPLLARFPVHVVCDDMAALTGCARYLKGLSEKSVPV